MYANDRMECDAGCQYSINALLQTGWGSDVFDGVFPLM